MGCVVICCRCQRERPEPIRFNFNSIDGFLSSVTQKVVRVLSRIWDHFRRLQAMWHMDGRGALQMRSQIAIERHPRHPGAVSIKVFQVPAWNRSMSVGGIQCLLKKGVGQSDACVQKCDI